jgi:hypothetical protein
MSELCATLTGPELVIATRALVDSALAWDRRADVLLASRTSHASPENRERNVEIVKSAERYREHARLARALLLRLAGQ